jgi:3-oxoacyl-[acyl-carrier protein] reductase
MPGSNLPSVALVTGASRGIGRVIARRLADSGIAVAINYHSSESEAQALASEIEASGTKAVALQADVSCPTEAADLFRRAEDVLGPVDIVINNAGITRDRLLIQMSEADWAATWTTNLAGPRALGRVAVEVMCGRMRGRLVNIGSVVGSIGNAGQSNYAASKAALLGLTRQLALEAASSGVTVNCVVPGYILTDATAHLSEAHRAQWLQQIPMRRYATTNEVADIAVFLVGPGAAYITGQCVAVDGGLLAAAGGGLAS